LRRRLLAPLGALLLPACGGFSGGGAPARVADLEAVRAALAAAKGKPLVVNHWATWCAPCVDELPILTRLARAHAARVGFLGVSWDRFAAEGGLEETVAKVRAVAGRAGLPYETLVFGGPPESLWDGLGLSARTVPQTFVLDAAGREVARFEDEVVEEALEAAIRRASGGP
jgi:thiol-disulfide isomerase/thioredoxin